MRSVPIRDACRGLSALIGSVRYGGARLLLTSRGRPAAALISVRDLAALLERAAPPPAASPAPVAPEAAS
jgi:prevent-host-death family protein